MAAIGLLYVGAVLFVNGIMLAGLIDGRSAAPLNLFVGLLQVVTPTYLIFTANGDPDALLNASGLYLFGFTYLYVAFILFMGIDGGAFGYYSLFVAIAAVGYSFVNFIGIGDPVFGVIWLYWAFLWTLFFLVFGRRVERLTRYTGIVAAIQGWVTGAIPSALLLLNVWGQHAKASAIVFTAFGLIVFSCVYFVERQKNMAPSTAAG